MNNIYFDNIYKRLEDLGDIQSYKDVELVNYEDVEELKKTVFNKSNTRGSKETIDILCKILKYQKEDNAPWGIIWKTFFNLVNHLLFGSNRESTKDEFIILGTLSFLLSLEESGKTTQKVGSNIEVENDCIPENEKTQFIVEEKKIKRIRFYLLIGFIKQEGKIRNPGEKLFIENLDFGFLEIIKEIFQILGTDIWQELYKTCPHYLKFYIIYEIYNEQHIHVDENILIESQIFSPYQFAKNKHPYTTKSLEEIKTYCNICNEKYRQQSKKSKLYTDFSFDCGYLNIIRQKNNYDTIITEIKSFKEKYKYISYKIKNSCFEIKGIDEYDSEHFINQWLYFDMQESIYTIKYLLNRLETNDFRKLFDYLNHDVIENCIWINDEIFLENDDNKKRYYIIELSRIFLYKKIRQKEFDRIHSIYEETRTNSLLRNIYNLVLGKFCLAYISIGVTYFTEGYHILLKQMFKNFRLNTPLENLENFKLPKEAANDLGIYELENEDDIRELIFDEESGELEMKASIILDQKKFLKEKKQIILNEYSFLKPLVSFLNTNGGKIILGLREGEKLNEEITNNELTKEMIKDLYISDKTNNHYLTGIDEDIKMLGMTIDNLKMHLNEHIKQNIHPNPFVHSDTINIYIKKFLGKNICIINVPRGSTEYFIIKKNKEKEIIETKLYIRQNNSDHQIKTLKEAIDFSKSRNKL